LLNRYSLAGRKSEPAEAAAFAVCAEGSGQAAKAGTQIPAGLVNLCHLRRLVFILRFCRTILS
jgi:hypothetical protein